LRKILDAKSVQARNRPEESFVMVDLDSVANEKMEILGFGFRAFLQPIIISSNGVRPRDRRRFCGGIFDDI
jgi:hypothetical protein